MWNLERSNASDVYNPDLDDESLNMETRINLGLLSIYEAGSDL